MAISGPGYYTLSHTLLKAITDPEIACRPQVNYGRRQRRLVCNSEQSMAIYPGMVNTQNCFFAPPRLTEETCDPFCAYSICAPTPTRRSGYWERCCILWKDCDALRKPDLLRRPPRCRGCYTMVIIRSACQHGLLRMSCADRMMNNAPYRNGSSNSSRPFWRSATVVKS